MADGLHFPNWGKFFGWTAVYLLLGSAFALLTYLYLSAEMGRDADLDTTTQLAKAISLAVLAMIAAFEVFRHKECPVLIFYSNIVCIFFTFGVFMAIIIKIVVSQYIHIVPEGNFIPFYSTYDVLQIWGNEISVSPIILFALLNVLIVLYYLWKGVNNELRRAAACYFCISDVACIVPILSVMLMRNSLAPGPEGELFVSGAMAMFIVASNILALGVRFIVLPAIECSERLVPSPS